MSRFDHYTVFDPSASRFGVGLFCHDLTNSYAYMVGELLVTDPLQMSIGRIWPEVERLERIFFPTWADPIRIYDEAAKFFAIEMADQFNIGVAPTQKKQTDKANNISTVRDALVKRRFIIAEHCTNAIREMYNYKFDDNGKIVKKNDDVVDTILYFFMESGWSFQGVPTEEKGEGRRFYTPEEDYMNRSDEEGALAPSHDNILDDEDVEESLWDGISMF